MWPFIGKLLSSTLLWCRLFDSQTETLGHTMFCNLILWQNPKVGPFIRKLWLCLLFSFTQFVILENLSIFDLGLHVRSEKVKYDETSIHWKKNGQTMSLFSFCVPSVIDHFNCRNLLYCKLFTVSYSIFVLFQDFVFLVTICVQPEFVCS